MDAGGIGQSIIDVKDMQRKSPEKIESHDKTYYFDEVHCMSIFALFSSFVPLVALRSSNSSPHSVSLIPYQNQFVIVQ